jgi:hypothetical protein
MSFDATSVALATSSESILSSILFLSLARPRSSQSWADSSDRDVSYIVTNWNPRNEMHSVLETEMDDPLDPHAAPYSRNAQAVLRGLQVSDKIVVYGESGSRSLGLSWRSLRQQYDSADRIMIMTADARELNDELETREKLLSSAAPKQGSRLFFIDLPNNQNSSSFSFVRYRDGT